MMLLNSIQCLNFDYIHCVSTERYLNICALISPRGFIYKTRILPRNVSCSFFGYTSQLGDNHLRPIIDTQSGYLLALGGKKKGKKNSEFETSHLKKVEKNAILVSKI